MTVQELIEYLQKIEDKNIALTIACENNDNLYDENYELYSIREANGYFAISHDYTDKKCIIFKSWVNA